jgi:hypothetical protein
MAMSDISSVLAAGQSAFESLLTDTCKITAPGTGARTFNETTGQYTDPARVTVYEGPCRIQVKADINSNVVETTAGEREWTYLTAQLQLPVNTPAGATGDVTAIKVDHVAEILTAPYSAAMVGRVFNIQGPYHKSHAVYLRFRVKEIVA